MAKDPAVNWYFDNWGGGTKTMSRFIKGCYIDLLDAQFHSGHLSLDEIKHVLGPDFSAWQTLRKKFEQDVHGNYFNERLDREINKRLENSKKQSERVKKRWDSYRSIYHGNTTVIPQDGIGIETGIDSSFGKSENLLPENEILEYLNESAGKRFKATDANLKFIRGRLSEKYSVEDLKSVVDVKISTWKGTEWDKYLRPETLFNATKFQTYIQEAEHRAKNPEKFKSNGSYQQNNSVGRVTPTDEL